MTIGFEDSSTAWTSYYEGNNADSAVLYGFDIQGSYDVFVGNWIFNPSLTNSNGTTTAFHFTGGTAYETLFGNFARGSSGYALNAFTDISATYQSTFLSIGNSCSYTNTCNLINYEYGMSVGATGLAYNNGQDAGYLANSYQAGTTINQPIISRYLSYNGSPLWDVKWIGDTHGDAQIYDYTYGGNRMQINQNGDFDVYAPASNFVKVHVGSPTAPVVEGYFNNQGFFAPLVSNPTCTLTGTLPVISTTCGMTTITLSGNTTSYIGTPVLGSRITLQICEPATGGPYTWTWPSSGVFHNASSLSSTTAGNCLVQSFYSFNGSTYVADGPGEPNVAP
jgi:hypothetical protein